MKKMLMDACGMYLILIENSISMDILSGFMMMMTYSWERREMGLITMERCGGYKKMAHMMNMM